MHEAAGPGRVVADRDARRRPRGLRGLSRAARVSPAEQPGPQQSVVGEDRQPAVGVEAGPREGAELVEVVRADLAPRHRRAHGAGTSRSRVIWSIVATPESAHGQVELGHQVLHHRADAVRAGQREAVDPRPSDQHGLRPSARAMNASAPLRTPLSKSTGIRPSTWSTMPGSASSDADRAVDLAAAVVGDHDPVDAVLDRERRVARVLDALEVDRQAGALAQVVEVLPGERRPREHVEERLDRRPRHRRPQVVDEPARVVPRHRHQRLHGGQGRPRRRLALGRPSGGARLGQPPEDRVARVLRDALGPRERQVAEVEVLGAPAEHVRVEGDDDGVAADLLGPVHEGVDDLVLPAPVELVEPRRLAERAGGVLHRHRALRRDHHRDAEVARGLGDGVLRVLVRHLEHADRGEQQRRREPAPEQLDRLVAHADVDEHPRHDPVPAEGLEVGADGPLLAGPAGDVRPGLGLIRRRAAASSAAGFDGDDGLAPEDARPVDPALHLAADADRSGHGTIDLRLSHGKQSARTGARAAEWLGADNQPVARLRGGERALHPGPWAEPAVHHRPRADRRPPRCAAVRGRQRPRPRHPGPRDRGRPGCRRRGERAGLRRRSRSSVRRTSCGSASRRSGTAAMPAPRSRT